WRGGGGERAQDPRRVRRRERRPPLGDPAQCGRRDRRRRSRGRPQGGRRDRAGRARVGRRGGTPRPARRVLAGSGAGMRFKDALAAPGFGAIAEFKRRSPSAGDLRPDGDVEQVARSYEAGGARAMSVLVGERFGGTWDDLRAARAATKLPLLAKGFFTTPGQLEHAREAGADAVLLLLRDVNDAAAAA